MNNDVEKKDEKAWQALSYCIDCGQKERALGVFSLFAPSFDDEAIAQRLLGDILLFFADLDGAVPAYEKAAQLFVESKEYDYALGVYAQLIQLKPDIEQYRDEIDRITELCA